MSMCNLCSAPRWKTVLLLSVLVLYRFCCFRRRKSLWKKSWSSQFNKAGGGDGGGWARDFPARGCQMCDLSHHWIRATADSQLEASGNRGQSRESAHQERVQQKTIVEIWEREEMGTMTNRQLGYKSMGRKAWEKKWQPYVLHLQLTCAVLFCWVPAEWLLEASLTTRSLNMKSFIPVSITNRL